jgi:mevalonate kinase
MMAEGYAPGKLILSGEHAVVYGHIGVAVAVDRGVRVQLHRRQGPTMAESADPALRRALAVALPPNGIGVEIDSDLPAGMGMGSSAALSIATLRAFAAFQGEEWDFDELHSRGFEMERVFHGQPSGIDHAVSILGGGIEYRSSGGAPSFQPVPLPPLPLIVMSTGKPGSTVEMVDAVRAGLEEKRVIIDAIGQLTEALCKELKSGASLKTIGGMLHRNHVLLQDLGVSTPDIDSLVETAMAAGALGAKLSGAGGGGVAFALATDPEPVLEAVAQLGFEAFAVGSHSGGG